MSEPIDSTDIDPKQPEAPKQPEHESQEPKEPKDPEISNKEKRKIYADAINQFKNSDEFQDVINKAMQKGAAQATMSEKERAEAERKERERKDEEERKQFQQEKATFYAQQSLQAKGLPTSLAKYVAGADDDVLDEIKQIVDQSVQQGILEKMKGVSTPKTGNFAQNNLTKEEFSKMGLEERTKLYRDNPELYKSLSN